MVALSLYCVVDALVAVALNIVLLVMSVQGQLLRPPPPLLQLQSLV